MRAKASDYAPVGGRGYWKTDANFFASGGSGKWEGELSDEDLALFRDRLKELIPETRARDWLERSSGSAVAA